MAVADQLLQNQMLASPAEYLDILKTGNLDSVTDPKTAQKAYIQLENEQLAQGQKPIISYLDNPIEHIKEHMVLTFRPEVRSNAPIMEIVLEHVQEHLDQVERLNMGNPITLALATEQPVPLSALQQPPQGGPGGPGAATGAMPPQAGGEPPPEISDVAASGLKRALGQVERASQISGGEE
jgi:hypothetical protein